MMSAEGPYIAAIVARMPAAELNLAAYGVAFALAWLGESPIMMLLTASNRLVQHHQSFLAMRRFMYAMTAALTGLMIVAVLPPVFRLLASGVLHLPAPVADLLHSAMVILVPWPAAIGYRRFYQGVLVRHGHPRRVAYGTVIRLTSMSLTAAILGFGTSLHGATVGACALVAGVVTEAVAARWMARHVVASLLAEHDPADARVLTQREIVQFYYPLALTSMISMSSGPLLTFFMGRGRLPIESLAVLPVVQNVVFLFRSGGVAFQEVGVALIGHQHEHERAVRRAATILGLATSSALALLVFTPLVRVWFGSAAGLTPALTLIAILPARILVIHPALEYTLGYQRARVILAGATRVVTAAMVIEVGGIAAALWFCIGRLDIVGVVAASIALMGGRLAANAFLFTAARLERPPTPA